MNSMVVVLSHVTKKYGRKYLRGGCYGGSRLRSLSDDLYGCSGVLLGDRSCSRQYTSRKPFKSTVVQLMGGSATDDNSTIGDVWLPGDGLAAQCPFNGQDGLVTALVQLLRGGAGMTSAKGLNLCDG